VGAVAPSSAELRETTLPVDEPWEEFFGFEEREHEPRARFGIEIRFHDPYSSTRIDHPPKAILPSVDIECRIARVYQRRNRATAFTRLCALHSSPSTASIVALARS
jgi:hypothetical protein